MTKSGIFDLSLNYLLHPNVQSFTYCTLNCISCEHVSYGHSTVYLSRRMMIEKIAAHLADWYRSPSYSICRSGFVCPVYALSLFVYGCPVP